MMQIKHYKHTEIDFKKWDNAIDRAKNSLIYAQSWYLNIVSPQWEALIVGNYEIVMSLPVKKKFGIKYLVQPILTQQLGIFSEREIEEKTVEEFIQKIPYFSYELHLNEQNKTKIAQPRVNLLLDLSADFSELESGFSKNTLRNINLAKKHEISTTEIDNPKEFLEYYFNTETNFSKPDETICRKLIEKGFENQCINLFLAKNKNAETIAAFCLLKSKGRLINLLPISNAEGKETSAMFLLIENIIKMNSGTDKVLDFEGSMIDGIARFYRGFGAAQTDYYLIKKFRPKILLGKL